MKQQQLALGALIAVIPTYNERGSGTEVWSLERGVEVVGRRPRKVMEHALRKLGMTWRAYQALYQDSCYGTQYLPVIGEGQAFMTCQMIRPRARGDATYGYIRVEAIKAVRPRGEETVIELYGGLEIVSVQTPLTVVRHRDRALGELHEYQTSRRIAEVDGARRLLSLYVSTWGNDLLPSPIAVAAESTPASLSDAVCAPPAEAEAAAVNARRLKALVLQWAQSGGLLPGFTEDLSADADEARRRIELTRILMSLAAQKIKRP